MRCQSVSCHRPQPLLAVPDAETIKGLRDRVLLVLLLGCGIRRGELAGLEFRDVAQREGRWAIVDLVGKHGRVRTVPMPSWAKTALDGWASAAGIKSGAVLRRVDKAGHVGPGPITAQAVFEAVVSYARNAGLGKISPHDLRRTFAKLAHLGRAPLELIQISLGHASIQTTERYLGLQQNLHDAPCDRLGLVGSEEQEGDKGLRRDAESGPAAMSSASRTREVRRAHLALGLWVVLFRPCCRLLRVGKHLCVQ